MSSPIQALFVTHCCIMFFNFRKVFSKFLFIFHIYILFVDLIYILISIISVSDIFCLFAFLQDLFLMHQQCLERRKTYEQLVCSFCFVQFVLNAIVFVDSGLKQNLVLQTRPNHFFFRFYVYFKKASCAVCGKTCCKFATMSVTFLCIFLIGSIVCIYLVSEFCINFTRDKFLVL